LGPRGCESSPSRAPPSPASKFCPPTARSAVLWVREVKDQPGGWRWPVPFGRRQFLAPAKGKSSDQGSDVHRLLVRRAGIQSPIRLVHLCHPDLVFPLFCFEVRRFCVSLSICVDTLKHRSTINRNACRCTSREFPAQFCTSTFSTVKVLTTSAKVRASCACAVTGPKGQSKRDNNSKTA